ncbi:MULTISPECIES: enoyl-CoA hydratase-related protein [unclassified Pseudonocardia]|uniref:enoyl-CoA hydratase-related protein n=1 Tax=unclassified Pseudonocardia TaxID=2619320 RepID=UPI00095968EC|nr:MULTISPECIES: enoyl-CoA hydratase-related protein [unclassified Pseudonocardia]MBN9097796.1 enoyl-CoA hydratase/isomerase family protein [Pseudonocardia sp.]OJY46315.1 MAG: 1,4-dihydroxy-6-naphthoate synthase [Pseudonocardia sp. 73-21]
MTQTTATYTEILYDVADSVATITINRPDKLNSFTPVTVREMIDAFRRAGADSDVGVIVLTGAGERAFCAGGDMSWEKEGGLKELRDNKGGGDDFMVGLYDAMRDCLKPVIAKVRGWCIGGGNHLAYHCDLTIASDDAKFGQNGPRVGSPASGAIVSYLVRTIGAKRAREMWLVCRRYTAAQMLDWGLVNAVVPADELDAEVRRWANDMLALSPTVLKVLKKSFDDEYQPLRDRQIPDNFLEEINPTFFESGEQQEGATAFLEKRKPDFSPYR